MRLSEMIDNLQRFKEEHGDVECWRAIDDEAYECSEVVDEPIVMFTDGYGNAYCQEDLDNGEVYIDDVEMVCVIN